MRKGSGHSDGSEKRSVRSLREIERAVDVRIGHGGEKRLRIGMNRVAEEGGFRRLLDDVAPAHHGDGVGDVVHDREVVRDEEVGQPERRSAGP